MIYGYLRVSSDEQDVNSQRQGVESFCKEHSWQIDKYITDEGVSGGKDPDKRNLGPLLKLVIGMVRKQINQFAKEHNINYQA